jgi:hypothetical protein
MRGVPNPANRVAASFRDYIATRAQHFDVIAFAMFACAPILLVPISIASLCLSLTVTTLQHVRASLRLAQRLALVHRGRVGLRRLRRLGITGERDCVGDPFFRGLQL